VTEIFNDNLQVTLLIDGEEWLVKEAEVVRTRISTPDYVDLMMIPSPDTLDNLPDNINNLIGAEFELIADNTIITNRDTDADEDSLLFKGNLGNISPTGENVYEGIGYDPGQQSFETEQSRDELSSYQGSIMNQSIYIPMPEINYASYYSRLFGTRYRSRNIRASELVGRIVDRMGLTDYKINLEIGGIEVENEEGSYRGAYDALLYFEDAFPKIKDALEKARNQCQAEWFFDKEGTFHFGLPDPTKHELKFITDADAGKTTPPYQSVRVIGSGSASQEGYSRTNMNMEDPVVVEAEIAYKDDGSGDVIANFGETTEPTFIYRNAEITTTQQARNTAEKLIEDLSEQQADGKVTVVGFPEIMPLDGIVMPNGEAGDYPDNDIRNSQPMGGMGYNVYKVVHRLNNSDGFITIIHVAGVTGVTGTVVSSSQASTTYDEDEVTEVSGRGPTPDQVTGATPIR